METLSARRDAKLIGAGAAVGSGVGFLVVGASVGLFDVVLVVGFVVGFVVVVVVGGPAP